jgi:hypothetical protein
VLWLHSTEASRTSCALISPNRHQRTEVLRLDATTIFSLRLGLACRCRRNGIVGELAGISLFSLIGKGWEFSLVHDGLNRLCIGGLDRPQHVSLRIFLGNCQLGQFPVSPISSVRPALLFPYAVRSLSDSLLKFLFVVHEITLHTRLPIQREGPIGCSWPLIYQPAKAEMLNLDQRRTIFTVVPQHRLAHTRSSVTWHAAYLYVSRNAAIPLWPRQ